MGPHPAPSGEVGPRRRGPDPRYRPVSEETVHDPLMMSPLCDHSEKSATEVRKATGDAWCASLPKCRARQRHASERDYILGNQRTSALEGGCRNFRQRGTSQNSGRAHADNQFNLKRVLNDDGYSMIRILRRAPRPALQFCTLLHGSLFIFFLSSLEEEGKIPLFRRHGGLSDLMQVNDPVE